VKERLVARRHPMTKSESPDEDSNASQDGIEEIESSHRSDAHEVEKRPLDAHVRERLMQALEHSIRALLLLRFVGHKFLVERLVRSCVERAS
jgi:hypothetical protein